MHWASRTGCRVLATSGQTKIKESHPEFFNPRTTSHSAIVFGDVVRRRLALISHLPAPATTAFPQLRPMESSGNGPGTGGGQHATRWRSNGADFSSRAQVVVVRRWGRLGTGTALTLLNISACLATHLQSATDYSDILHSLRDGCLELKLTENFQPIWRTRTQIVVVTAGRNANGVHGWRDSDFSGKRVRVGYT